MANKFDFEYMLRYLPRPIVETLYDLWTRTGGAPSVTRTLSQVNNFVEEVDANSQSGNNDAVTMARLKRLEREINDIKAQL